MIISSLELVNKSDIDTIIEQSIAPTIIGIARKHSFGARWINYILDSLENEYKNQFLIFIYHYENTNKVVSFLGEKKSLIMYLVKDKEIKSCIAGSVAKSIFREELEKFLH